MGEIITLQSNIQPKEENSRINQHYERENRIHMKENVVLERKTQEKIEEIKEQNSENLEEEEIPTEEIKKIPITVNILNNYISITGEMKEAISILLGQLLPKKI